jgi:hypothetical protein
MFVVVPLVGGVPTTVVDVVDVVAVRDRHMAASIAVGVVMFPFVNGVLVGFALVVVAVVSFVKVSVMDVIDVVAVRDGDVPAPLAVGVFVPNMFRVNRAHYRPSSHSRWENRFDSGSRPTLLIAHMFANAQITDGPRIPPHAVMDDHLVQVALKIGSRRTLVGVEPFQAWPTALEDTDQLATLDGENLSSAALFAVQADPRVALVVGGELGAGQVAPGEGIRERVQEARCPKQHSTARRLVGHT